ncbi:hypothetical protein [Butyrivibrio sp. YAB3001]|uniref:hypothetical protein n=1 Tax=Butyrivibrio sp. YAB3001 TaxID=1520812 RepID=UPI0008F65A78|nr:hypothetical protein [Butyrivibrio sp. YAB3001]SFC74418.1 hypothetical protein SAMN02910398_03041 [Butyrivibrio sp. YAB3001]
MVENRNYKFLNYIVFALGICALVIIYVLKAREIVLRADYQWEVREGVVLNMAQRFAAGVNPYEFHDGLPEPVYMYGIVLPVLLSVLIRFGINDIILASQILTLGVEIFGVIVFGVILMRRRVNMSLIPIGLIGISSCYFRLAAYGGIFPDAYGLTLLIIIWSILQSDENKCHYRIIIYALLCTIEFYVKQYYVFIALGFLVYFALKKEYKMLLKFAVIGSCVGIVSIVLIRLFFPTYFTTNTFFLGIYNKYSFKLAFEQLLSIIQTYSVMFLTFLFFVTLKLFRYKKANVDIVDIDTYSIAQGITMLLIGTLLSTSNGAWITYYLQLFVPYLLFLAIIIWDGIAKRIKISIPNYYISAIEVVLLAIVVLSIKRLVFVQHITDEQKKEWEEVYTVLDEYKDCNIKMSALPLNFYCLKNGIYSDNPGHSNCYTYELMDLVDEKSPNSIIYPYAKELTEQFMQYNEESLKKCANGYYDCVVVEKNNYYSEEIENAISQSYRKVNDYNLVCGVEKWECTIYVKK